MGTDLGQVLDSWSELLDNHAGVYEALREEFLLNITARNIPEVSHTPGDLSVGGKTRGYFFSSRKSGATVTTNINQYGTDLFIKWTLWWKPQLNWKVLLAILLASLIFGIVAVNVTSGAYGPYGAPFAVVLGAFIATSLGWSIGILVLIVVLGIFLRGGPLGFLLTEFDLFNQDDAIALSFAVDHSLRQAADAVGIKIKLRDRTDFYTGKRSRLIDWVSSVLPG